jgi:hypothetical protein
MKKVLIIGFLAAVLGFSTLANANLLNNPGFETGDFTRWIIGGTSLSYGVATAGGSVMVRSGLYAGYADVDTNWTYPNQHYLSLSQTVPVVAGSTYNIGFWEGNPGVGAGDGITFVNGEQIYLNGGRWCQPTQGWWLRDNTWTAPAGTSTADITFIINGSGTGMARFSFDDFFFTPSSVPIPPTILLFGSWLIGVGFLRKRLHK